MPGVGLNMTSSFPSQALLQLDPVDDHDWVWAWLNGTVRRAFVHRLVEIDCLAQ